MKKLFTRDDVSNEIVLLITRLEALPTDQATEKSSLIKQVLTIIASNRERFDDLCQLTIEWGGEKFVQLVHTALDEGVSDKNLDALYSMLFRLVCEFDLSQGDEISDHLRRLGDYVDANPSAFSSRALAQIQFARQQMPIAILKKLIGNPILQNIVDPKKMADVIDAKIASWEKDLAEREATANRLKDALSSYTTAFNFVGLHQGFDNLSTQKKVEVTTLRWWLVVFGVLASAPLVAELTMALYFRDRLSEWSATALVAVIPAFSLTILFIYFFRIVLHRAEAARSQLLQIELRKTLCQFIQSYADYAQEIKVKTPDSLAKFENMIFSGIVSKEEKLPTTFDGFDQLSKLIHAARGPK